MYGGSITGNHAFHGGVSLYEDATFNMYGGSITGNSGQYGGGVYVGGATFCMYGGSISNNTTTASFTAGGVTAEYSSFHMYGGSISGNRSTAASYGHGGVYFRSNSNSNTISVSGNSVIQDNTVNDAASNLFSNCPILLSAPLTAQAAIGVTGGTGIFTSGWTEQMGSSEICCFSSDNPDLRIALDDSGELKLEKPHMHTVCLDDTCQDDHETIDWQPWTSTTSLPKSTGYYYLVNDVVLTAYHRIASDADVSICLNGKSVTLDKDTGETAVIRIYDGQDLVITDCGSTVRYGNIDAETNLWIPSNTSGNCDLVGGLITSGGSLHDGIYVFGGTLAMYGGNIAGNAGGIFLDFSCDVWFQNSTIVGNANNMRSGVHVSSNSTFNMYSGSIRNNAGGVTVYSNGTFNMYGGSVSEHTAISYGGVFLAGTMNMYGGSICNNIANYYAGVYVSSDAALNMYGGSITNNTASSTGGGVYLYNATSALSVSGNAVIDGNTANGKANNVHIATAFAPITLTDPLTETAHIGISMATPGVFTTGWTEQMGNSEIIGFFSDSGESLPVAMDPSGELRLGVHTHSWGQWTVDTAPTTEAAGSLIRHCSADLAHDETLVLPALNDTDYTVTVSIAPTLIAPGENIYTYTEPETQQDFSFSVVVPAIGQEMIDRVTVTTNPDTGAITMENIPDGVIVVLAGYNGGKMVQVQFRTGDTVTFSPMDAEAAIAFFLTGNYIPVAQPKTIS